MPSDVHKHTHTFRQPSAAGKPCIPPSLNVLLSEKASRSPASPPVHSDPDDAAHSCATLWEEGRIYYTSHPHIGVSAEVPWCPLLPFNSSTQSWLRSCCLQTHRFMSCLSIQSYLVDLDAQISTSIGKWVTELWHIATKACLNPDDFGLVLWLFRISMPNAGFIYIPTRMTV